MKTKTRYFVIVFAPGPGDRAGNGLVAYTLGFPWSDPGRPR